MPIVDMRRCCACNFRLRVIQCIFELCIAFAVCAGACYSWCFGCSFAPPRRRTSQCRRTFVPFSVSHWNKLSCPVFDGVGLAVLRAEPMLFGWPNLHFHFVSYFFFLFLPLVVVWGGDL